PPSFGSSPEQPELNTVLHAITIGDATAVIRRAARDTCAVRDTISVMTGIDTRAILDVQGLCLTPRRAHAPDPVVSRGCNLTEVERGSRSIQPTLWRRVSSNETSWHKSPPAVIDPHQSEELLGVHVRPRGPAA